MSMFEFPKYKRPHLEQPSRNRTRDSAAMSDAGEMPTESLSDLLGRVSENSTAQIDNLLGEFERLRGKLQTDAERI